MAQDATKNLHLRHQETWSVPTSCATRAPSVSTGAIIFPEGGVRNQLYRKDVQYLEWTGRGMKMTGSPPQENRSQYKTNLTNDMIGYPCLLQIYSF